MLQCTHFYATRANIHVHKSLILGKTGKWSFCPWIAIYINARGSIVTWRVEREREWEKNKKQQQQPKANTNKHAWALSNSNNRKNSTFFCLVFADDADKYTVFVVYGNRPTMWKACNYAYLLCLHILLFKFIQQNRSMWTAHATMDFRSYSSNRSLAAYLFLSLHSPMMISAKGEMDRWNGFVEQRCVLEVVGWRRMNRSYQKQQTPANKIRNQRKYITRFQWLRKITARLHRCLLHTTYVHMPRIHNTHIRSTIAHFIHILDKQMVAVSAAQDGLTVSG